MKRGTRVILPTGKKYCAWDGAIGKVRSLMSNGLISVKLERTNEFVTIPNNITDVTIWEDPWTHINELRSELGYCLTEDDPNIKYWKELTEKGWNKALTNEDVPINLGNITMNNIDAEVVIINTEMKKLFQKVKILNEKKKAIYESHTSESINLSCNNAIAYLEIMNNEDVSLMHFNYVVEAEKREQEAKEKFELILRKSVLRGNLLNRILNSNCIRNDALRDEAIEMLESSVYT